MPPKPASPSPMTPTRKKAAVPNATPSRQTTPVRPATAPAPRTPGLTKSKMGTLDSTKKKAKDTSAIQSVQKTAKPSDGKIILNNKKLLEFVNLGPYQPTCQYLYARDNFLHNFYGMALMPNLRVLDCSQNDIENMAFLEVLPQLKHLYLNSNGIQSIEDLPVLPELEILSLSNNKLSTLEGMKTQPSLRVLFLSNNQLVTFRGLPALPKLEVLRIKGNPISESCPRIRLAAILATTPTLAKLDGEDVTDDERAQASHYHVKCSVAIRAGWELCPGDRVQTANEAHAFLTSLQKFVTSDAPCKLIEGKITGNAAEWSVLTGMFAFQCEGHTHASNADAATLPSHLVGSFNFQWFRINRCGVETIINGADQSKYTATDCDVGHSLKVVCMPVLPDGSFGSSCYAMSDDVIAGAPLCRQLTVTGFPVENSILEASALYIGGKEGASQYRWMRCVRRDPPLLVSQERTYVLCAADVDAFVRLEFTPVRVDGVQGPTVFTNTAVIKPADPSVSALRVTSTKGTELVEGVPVLGEGKYVGGQEGTSRFSWVRVMVPQGTSAATVPYAHVIKGADAAEYTPTAADVGHYLKFIYTPVRIDGKSGPAVATMTTTLVKACKPTVSRVRIEGSLSADSVLSVSYQYVGGAEGKTKIEWFMGPASTKARSLTRSTSQADWRRVCEGKTFKLEAVDQQKGIYVQVSPVRDDSLKGTPVVVFAGVVGSCNPVVERIDVKGELKEGCELVAEGYLAGGAQGSANYEWQRSTSEGSVDEFEEEIEGDRWETVCTSPAYVITTADIGCSLRVVYTPLKADGAPGDAAWYLCDGKVQAKPPTVQDVSIEMAGEGILAVGALCKGVGRWAGPGDEGESVYVWYRVCDTARTEVGRGLTYTLVPEDANCRICFSYQPVRTNGMAGEPVLFETLETVIQTDDVNAVVEEETVPQPEEAAPAEQQVEQELEQVQIADTAVDEQEAEPEPELDIIDIEEKAPES